MTAASHKVTLLPTQCYDQRDIHHAARVLLVRGKSQLPSPHRGRCGHQAARITGLPYLCSHRRLVTVQGRAGLRGPDSFLLGCLASVLSQLLWPEVGEAAPVERVTFHTPCLWGQAPWL